VKKQFLQSLDNENIRYWARAAHKTDRKKKESSS
jgi:hypothetical protein